MSIKELEEAALRHLARYATSAENLRRVLMRRLARAAPARGQGETQARKEIDALLARFRSAGLLDDRAYAEAVVRTQRRRGASGPAIRARLAAKGVDRQTIDAV
ncbi:MAG: RecX family transcriptional regulator, partial [Alphaproteobacteria bacterium]